MATLANLRPQARWFICLIVSVGTTAVVYSSVDLALHPISDYDFYALAALTLISGSITVTVPAISATISVSEAFTFTSVILFGASAGTAIVALDALIISLWLQIKKGQAPYKTLFNVAAPAVSIWLAAHLFFRLVDIAPFGFAAVLNSFDSDDRWRRVAELVPRLLVPLMAFTVLYFVLNSFLVATAIALQSGKKPTTVWREHFVWVSVNFFGAASVSALLVPYWALFGSLAVGIIMPLLVISYLTYKTSIDKVLEANEHVDRLNTLYLSTIEALAMAIDAGDQITHGHIRRVQSAAIGLAKSLGVRDETQLKAIQAAALLHDIGKLAVPDHILNKPGRLTPAEYEKMKLHALKGAEILSSIEFPYPVIPIVRHHHENWDGTGYPDGLAGTEIPIGARILSVVDCYDALMSDRPYRPKLPRDQALSILLERRGTMYDPLLIDAFVALSNQIVEEPEQQPTPERTSGPRSDRKPQAGVHDERIPSLATEMIGLCDLTRALAGQVPFSDACEIIATRLRRMIGFSTCIFYWYEASTDELTAAHVVTDQPVFPSQFRIALGERISGWVAANRTSIVNANPALDLGDLVDTAAIDLRACLSVPLLSDGSLLGVLTLYTGAATALSDEHRKVLETVSVPIAGMLSRAAATDRDPAADFTDDVTGLPNRAKFQELAAGQLSSCFVSDPTVSLVFVRVVDLKVVDETWGKTSVRTLLNHVSQILRDNLRAADIAFKYDDDQFVVVLNQTDVATACGIADRVADTIARTTVVLGQGVDYVVKVQTSVASRPDDAESLRDLASVARSRLRSDSAAVGCSQVH